jgi:hypothetical protein
MVSFTFDTLAFDTTNFHDVTNPKVFHYELPYGDYGDESETVTYDQGQCKQKGELLLDYQNENKICYSFKRDDFNTSRARIYVYRESCNVHKEVCVNILVKLNQQRDREIKHFYRTYEVFYRFDKDKNAFVLHRKVGTILSPRLQHKLDYLASVKIELFGKYIKSMTT